MGLSQKILALTNTAMTGIVTSAAVARVTPAAALLALGQACPDNTSDVINLTGYRSFGITGVSSAVATVAAVVFTVVAATDIVTSTAHGCKTGQATVVSTTTTLPAPLTATTYYMIVIDANTFYLATTLANALAGTKIDITDTGTGTHTQTPAALAGGSYTLQQSNDLVNWSTDVAAVNITSAAVMAPIAPTSRIALFKYARIYYAITAGQMTVALKVCLNN